MITKNIHFKRLILPHRTITRFSVYYKLQQYTKQCESVVKPRRVPAMRTQKQSANTTPYPLQCLPPQVQTHMLAPNKISAM